MKTISKFLTLATLGLFLSSCIQHSTVLRVRKDGSGEIFVRNHFSPTMAAMAGGLAQGLGGAAPEGAEVNVEEMKPGEVDVDQVKADAANYGEGVRYSRHEENKNKEGWEGNLVVYEFDDINKVVLDSNSAMPEGINEGEAEVEGEPEGSKITFAMADGVLKIKTGMGEDAITQFKEGGGPAGGEGMPEGMKPSQMMAMMGGMLQGMRMGYFVRAEGGIEETNATHVKGEYITLMDMDVTGMLSDPEFLAFVDAAAEKPEDVTEESVEELAKQIESMNAEMQEEVTVKFK